MIRNSSRVHFIPLVALSLPPSLSIILACNFYNFHHNYGLWFLTFKLVLVGRKFHFIFKSFLLPLYFSFSMIQERLEKKEEEFFLFALRLGKTQIVATVADKKTFPVTFIIILLLVIIMMMGFWKLFLSSLFFIVMCRARAAKTIRSWQFHFCQHFISGKQRMCRKFFLWRFLLNFCPRQKQFFAKEDGAGTNSVWKLSWWRIK